MSRLCPPRATLAVALPALLALVCAPPAARGQQPAPVVVVTPQPAEVGEELRLTGTVTAEQSSRLSPRVDGLVARLHVDAGSRVKAGAPLLALDAELAELAQRRAQATADEARAQLAESRRLYAEAQRLVAEKHLPQTELARRESAVALAAAAAAAAEAAEREAAELVRRHVLPAPFAGVVSRRLTNLGEWVSRGTPVLELVATGRVRLDVQAPQERYTDIGSDAKVTVQSGVLGDRSLPGRIVARVPVGDTSARTFLVRIVVDAGDAPLLPGTSATAIIALPGAREALVVPRDAVLRYPDGTHAVFVVREAEGRTIAQQRRVRLGRGGARVEVLEGLAPGDRVVVRGNEALRDGQAVRVTAGG